MSEPVPTPIKKSKKKRQPVNKVTETVYLVAMTRYEDDYKHRYDDGVYSESIKVFANITAAEKFICERLCSEIVDCISDYELVVQDEDKEYFEFIEEELKIKENVSNKLYILDDLKRNYLKGEYVDYIFDYDLDMCIVNK